MLNRNILKMGVILIMLTFFGCGNKINETDLDYFYYSYDGSIGGNNYSYELKDGVLKYFAMDKDYRNLEMQVDDKLFKELKELYIEYKVYNWNGFDKYNKYVLDGEGFSLNINFEDGERLRAHGSNSFPNNYFEFQSKLDEIMKPYIEEMKNNYIAELVSKGVDGHLCSIMLHYIDKENGDDYNISIYKTDNKSHKNFSVDIKNNSNKDLSEENFYIYGHLDNEYIKFEHIEELINSYSILAWSDFHGNSDKKDTEWFQISFEFDDENHTRINAYGSLYPDNYFEFKDEALRYLIPYIRNVSSNVVE
ncbi:MAG: hypothetical protein IJH31_02010 [Erysipelotrichaceae bacterium]|nr:hypothetical protein [Erysipelotrichaceae bacterium]